jgi:hypothetical protein
MLRCPYPVDRVATAAIDPVRLRATVEDVLDRLLATGQHGPDVPAVATVLRALSPLLCPTCLTRPGQREELPEELADDVVVVESGAELRAVIEAR